MDQRFDVALDAQVTYLSMENTCLQGTENPDIVLSYPHFGIQSLLLQ